MAANKVAFVLRKTKNNHSIVEVLKRAVLEWILILLLLANSLFSCFVTKFARHFGLEKPCTLCAKLNHFLEPDGPGISSSLGHVCEPRGSEFSMLSYCTSHQRLAECDNLCRKCSSFLRAHTEKQNEISPFVSFLTWAKFESTRCSCCGELLLRRNFVDCTKKGASAEEDNGDEPSETTAVGSKSSSAPQKEESDDYLNGDRLDGFVCIEMTDTESTSSEKPPPEYSVQECWASIEEAKDDDRATDIICEVTNDHQGTEEDAIIETSPTDDDKSASKERLREKIKSQQKALDALYSELEEERKASAISANETMAMITKLQGEKSAMQMEANQYQRMMEEQAEYDQEALQLLNALVVRREKEKQELETELEFYRNNTKIPELDGENLKSSVGDSSLADFDEERLMSVLEDLKILEARLLFLLNDDKNCCSTANELLPLFDEAYSDERELSNKTRSFSSTALGGD